MTCRYSAFQWGDDPGYMIADHMVRQHRDDLIYGLSDDTQHHLAVLINDAHDTTGIDPLVISERTENFLNDWTR